MHHLFLPKAKGILLISMLFLAACTERADPEGTPDGTARKEALQQAGGTGRPEMAPPSREDVLLIQRLRNASDQEVKEYISEVVNMELPEDYVIPQDIIDAGHPKLAAEVIAARYPEISGQQGVGLVYVVRQHPLLYRQVVMESKAMRKVYKDHETVRQN